VFCHAFAKPANLCSGHIFLRSEIDTLRIAQEFVENQ
jgi:hypothetical protein